MPEGIGYGDEQRRTPQNADPRLDNFFRDLLAGKEGGGPLGVLPQSPTQQVGIGRVPQPATGAPPIFPPSLDADPNASDDILASVPGIDPIAEEPGGIDALAFEDNPGIPNNPQGTRFSPQASSVAQAVNTPVPASGEFPNDVIEQRGGPITDLVSLNQQAGNAIANLGEAGADLGKKHLVDPLVNLGQSVANDPIVEQLIQRYMKGTKDIFGPGVDLAKEGIGAAGDYLGDAKDRFIALLQRERGTPPADVPNVAPRSQPQSPPVSSIQPTPDMPERGLVKPPQQTSFTSPLIPEGVTTVDAIEEGGTGIDAIIKSRGLLDKSEAERAGELSNLPEGIRLQVLQRIDDMLGSANVGITDVPTKNPDQFTDFGV